LEEAHQLVAVLRGLGDALGILQLNPESWFKAESSTGLANAAIDALVVERIESKKSKSFARADEIRKELLAQGIVLEDRKDGTTDWRRE